MGFTVRIVNPSSVSWLLLWFTKIRPEKKKSKNSMGQITAVLNCLNFSKQRRMMLIYTREDSNSDLLFSSFQYVIRRIVEPMITHLAWYSYSLCICPTSIVYYTSVIFLFLQLFLFLLLFLLCLFPWYIIVIWNGKETGSNFFSPEENRLIWIFVGSMFLAHGPPCKYQPLHFVTTPLF